MLRYHCLMYQHLPFEGLEGSWWTIAEWAVRMGFFPSIPHFVLFFLLLWIWLFYYPTTRNCDINDIAPHPQVRHRRMKIIQGFQPNRGQEMGLSHLQFSSMWESHILLRSCLHIPANPQCLRGLHTKASIFLCFQQWEAHIQKGKKIPQVNTGVEDEIQEILRKEGQPNKSLKCQKLVTRRGV